MKILIVVDMQKDFISGPLGTAEARAIVPYVAEKAKNTPRENLFVTLDTHQPNYKMCIRDRSKSVETVSGLLLMITVSQPSFCSAQTA